jgi:UDP-N-acetylmuramoyl-tripeptide--D-alanyl-D-alanine ligase
MKIDALHACYLNCNSISTDTRKVAKNDMFFALKGDNFNGNTFAEKALNEGAKYVIIDEEEYYIDSQTILVDNVLETLQTLATFHRTYLNIPIIALTGSNGKTTTKELINAVLSKAYKTTATIGNLNNHIGVPLTLLSMTKDTEIGIVEMGANHLKEIEFLCEIAKPDFGYITNFGKAHLEGFGSIEGVIKGKTELYNYLKVHNKTIFVNANDAEQVKQSKDSNCIRFGDSNTENTTKIDLIDTQPFVKSNYNDLEIKSQLIGEYNFNNISAAICIGTYFKVSTETIKLAIEEYCPTNNRSQIFEKGTIKIILDAYNANPTSMKAALSNFGILNEPNKIAILGDMFELGKEADKEHQELVEFVLTLNLTNIILVGENFFKTKISSETIKKYKSFKDLKDKLNRINLSQATLLIKGSRGMALERVIDEI